MSVFGLFFVSSFLFLGNVHGQIRSHGLHPERNFNYSYINVRHVKGHKLTKEEDGVAVSPITTISTRNRTDCHRECIKTIDTCKSINVDETTDGVFQCETMPFDIYNARTVLVPKATSTHYIIAVNISIVLF